MKTILSTTYAVNPYKGSEDGMGWNFVLQIARFNNVIAITRMNNRSSIEQYMLENPSELYSRIRFLYFDLPYWMRFWKKGSHAAMLYYLMWQYGIVAFIKKQGLHFDIVHNVNFHNDWSPTFLWKLGKPMVWGPVGHHPLIPKQYLHFYSISYFILDRLIWLIKQFFWKYSSSLQRSVQEASHIMCMNHAVPQVLKIKGKYSVSPSIATQDYGWETSINEASFTVISAGRFVPLKGFDLTIQSFAKMLECLNEEEKKKCRLLLIGSGPVTGLLEELVASCQIDDFVTFIPWICREELMRIFKTSSVFLFPSHEGAGMVVAEALSFGVPVVCLANEGPGEFITNECGVAVPMENYDNTIKGLSNALVEIFRDKPKHLRMKIAARKRFEQLFHWDRRGEQLQKIYNEL